MPIDFLKLDVQGSEGQVLTDLAEAGRLEDIDQIVVEYHHDGDSDLAWALELLRANGFAYRIDSRRGGAGHANNRMYWCMHFVPRKDADSVSAP
jgi:hypothetical protein